MLISLSYNERSVHLELALHASNRVLIINEAPLLLQTRILCIVHVCRKTTGIAFWTISTLANQLQHIQPHYPCGHVFHSGWGRLEFDPARLKQ